MLATEKVKQCLRASRTFRIVIGALLLCVVTACGALLLWGTRWKIPTAETAEALYEFFAYWDGAAIPSGPFDRPFGIAVAPDGDVYVTDARKRVVRLGLDGQFKGQWGQEGKEPGDFSNPVGIAVAADGSVFVSDYDLDRIQQFTPDGKFLTAFGSSGSGAGQLNAPAGLAVDVHGAIYVADFYNHRIQKFGPEGFFQTTIGHPGRTGDGALHYPTDVRLAPQGQLLVADAYNYQIQRFDTDGQPMGRLNGIWAERNKLSGGKAGDSGGYTLFVSPGLQYVMRRWIAEISIQLPVVQNLNGGQLKTDFILAGGFRIQF